MTAATMVSVESSVPSSHHQVVTSFSLDPARPESPAAEVSVPEAASASHPPPQCASVHQQNIALRRQNRRHKLKLDITAAGHHHYHHRTLKLNLLSPGQSPPCDLAPPAGVPHLLMPSELSYSQGLKPIENQIGNPDFVRVRKPMSPSQRHHSSCSCLLPHCKSNPSNPTTSVDTYPESPSSAPVVCHSYGGKPDFPRPVCGVLISSEESKANSIASSSPTSPSTLSSACSSSSTDNGTDVFFSSTDSPVEPDEDDRTVTEANATPILPFLYLGNERDATDARRLDELAISYVLNVTSSLHHHGTLESSPQSERRPAESVPPDTRQYKWLPATDSYQQNLKQYFEEAFQFIDEARQRGRRVLVHCQAGISRSATITIAYVMRHMRYNLATAYRFVKQRRPIISPNLNFMGQLVELERLLSGKLLKSSSNCPDSKTGRDCADSEMNDLTDRS